MAVNSPPGAFEQKRRIGMKLEARDDWFGEYGPWEPVIDGVFERSVTTAEAGEVASRRNCAAIAFARDPHCFKVTYHVDTGPGFGKMRIQYREAT